MPWIEAPHEDDWDESLDGLKEQVIDPVHQRVDWVLRIHALDPGSMKAHHEIYRQAMSGTKTLRKVEREMIAVVVSQINQCHY